MAAVAELMASQILDPFRIGLLLALVLTAINTAGTVGMTVPLCLGAIFVAVLLPLTTQAPANGSMATAIVTGLVVNLAIVAVVLLVRRVWSGRSSSP